jgi:predicted nucleic-acid-binding protein
MIGLDTNVLVRYIMQDDAEQSPQATALVESLTVEAPGFVALVSVIELGWVLTSCFGLDRTQVATALEGLIRSKEITVERAEIVWQSVRLFRDGTADLGDCLIARSAIAAGCERTMTFDRGAAKACGMTLIQ